MAPIEKTAIRKVKAKIDPTMPSMSSVSTEEGCPIPYEVLVRRHRRTFLGSELERYEIYEVDLERLMIKYSVLDNFGMTIRGLDNMIVSPPSRCIAFYEDTFKAGVRFSLYLFITNILDFYAVTPTQFSSNSFRIIINFILIYDLCKIEPRPSLLGLFLC